MVYTSIPCTYNWSFLRKNIKFSVCVLSSIQYGSYSVDTSIQGKSLFSSFSFLTKLYFFRAVLSSQQNCAESAEIFQYYQYPTHAYYKHFDRNGIFVTKW